MTDHLPPVPNACGGPTLGVLRRYDTGELAAPDRAHVAAHLDACDACRGLLREFAGDRELARVAVPFEAIAARAVRPRPLATFWRRVALALALPVATAAAVLLLLPTPPAEEPGIRAKGARLEFVVRTADGSRPGTDGEALRPGDALRFRYDAQARPYVLIAGVNASGQVFPYLANGDRSAGASEFKEFAPNAVTLDQDLRPERVFALFSDDPVAVDEVRAAARDALAAAGDIAQVRALPLTMRGVDQATILLNKQAK